MHLHNHTTLIVPLQPPINLVRAHPIACVQLHDQHACVVRVDLSSEFLTFDERIGRNYDIILKRVGGEQEKDSLAHEFLDGGFDLC